MRLVSLALLLLLSAAPASANCTPGMVDVRYAWPADGVVDVPLNTHVLAQLHGTDAYLSQRLALELRAISGTPIALVIVADVRSGDSFMQQRSVVLRPARALAPLTAYRLVDVGTAPVGTRPTSFTTGTRRDEAAPTRVAVSPLQFHRRELGCGPVEEIELRVQVGDDAPLISWLRLRVAASEADLRAGRWLGETILVVDRGRARFGHGMCIGSWPIAPGQRLVASASVLDAAMHEVEAGVVVLDAS